MVDLDAAAALAEAAHRGQTRAHGGPYVEHPRAVRRFVEHLADAVGFAIDDDVRAVALLHDVLEDSGYTRADLEERFGAAVARRVAWLSKPKHAPGDDKAELTRRYFEKLDEEADDLTRLVKIADRLHNLSELPLTRKPERQRRYLEETRASLAPLAEHCQAPSLRAGLTSALKDGMAVCARLCGFVDEEALPALAGVYVIADLGPTSVEDEVLALVDAALGGGAALVQIRGKGVGDRRLLSVVEGALPSCRAARVPLIVNDRADVAMIAGADGVHVGREDLPPELVRRLLPVNALLGASSHTLAQAEEATNTDVLDYVAFGPVYTSPTKQGHAEVTGLEELRALVRASSLPVCAIGGITTPARMAEVGRAGAALGAVISAVQSADDPFEATRALGIALAAGRGHKEEAS